MGTRSIHGIAEAGLSSSLKRCLLFTTQVCYSILALPWPCLWPRCLSLSCSWSQFCLCSPFPELTLSRNLGRGCAAWRDTGVRHLSPLAVHLPLVSLNIYAMLALLCSAPRASASLQLSGLGGLPSKHGAVLSFPFEPGRRVQGGLPPGPVPITTGRVGGRATA